MQLAGWCAVRCHSNLWSSVRVRLARPCLTQPAPWGKRSFAQTSGQSSYPRETASQRQRVDPVLPRKTVGPSRTASRSLCIARTSIGCVLCHGSRWTRTSFFSVSADMFTRAGNTAVQDRGRLAARPAPRAARTGATQVDARNPRHSRPAVSLHAIPILRRYDPDQINERRTVTARA